MKKEAFVWAFRACKRVQRNKTHTRVPPGVELAVPATVDARVFRTAIAKLNAASHNDKLFSTSLLLIPDMLAIMSEMTESTRPADDCFPSDEDGMRRWNSSC
jgi:hypothetical protein